MTGYGDTPRTLDDFVRDSRSRLVALERRRSLLAEDLPTDTGWIGIALASGWSGNNGFAYRIKSGVVMFKGEFLGGADFSVVCTMPVGARPVARLQVTAPRVQSTAAPPLGSVRLDTAGVMTFANISGTIPTSSPGYSLAALTYTID